MRRKERVCVIKTTIKKRYAIGALIRKAEYADSKSDFVHKMNIALKEANEAEYWLLLLKETNYLSEHESISIRNNCDELIRSLVSIVKTTKGNLRK